MFLQNDLKLLLYLLDQKGPQPKWMYWDVASLKRLTKEEYITFHKDTLTMELAPKGKEWVTKNPFSKQLDLGRWIKEHAFCRTQTLVRETKCLKLIDFLVANNRTLELYPLFALIRERKKKIWNNRLIKMRGQVFLIINAVGDGPFSLCLSLVSLESGRKDKISTSHYRIDDVQEYVSAEKAEMLSRVFGGDNR